MLSVLKKELIETKIKRYEKAVNDKQDKEILQFLLNAFEREKELRDEYQLMYKKSEERLIEVGKMIYKKTGLTPDDIFEVMDIIREKNME